MGGRAHYFVEHTVYTIANPHDLLIWLHVNIARLFSDCVHQNQVHELYHRGLLGGGFESREVYVVRGLLQIDIDILLEHFQIIIQRVFCCKIVSDDFLDHAVRGDVNLDVLPGEEANVVDDEKVAGVRHGNVKGIAHKTERHGLVFVHDIERNHARNLFGQAKPG